MSVFQMQIVRLRLRYGLSEAHAQALAALIWGALS